MLLMVVEMLKKKLGAEAIEWSWGSDFFKIPSTLTIPDGCKRIGNSIFYNCTSLKEVIISEGCEEIGYKAFWGCARLKKVEIPKSVEIIKEWAFKNCSNATIILKKPKEEFKGFGFDVFYDCKDVKEEIRS